MKKKIIVCMAALLQVAGAITAQNEKNTFACKLGDYEVVLLSEGQNKGNAGILIGATQQMIDETIPDGTYDTAVNAFLVKTPGRNYLFDTGFGRNLANNLKSAGVSADDIHTLVITHMHGDHIGGMLKDGKRAFPNSTIQLSQVEHDYWTSDEEMNKLPEGKRGSFDLARKTLKAYEGKVELVRAEKLGKKVGDGVFFIEAYGHTPGHIACLIQSGNEQLLIWGDLTHAMAIQMPYPQIAVTYDVEPEAAVRSRLPILEFVAENHIPVAGMHIAYPGVGTVKKSSGRGYDFVPANLSH